jgi:heavy metal sensor kinase
MSKLSRLQSFQLPLRVRLTLWYTLSLGLIFVVFATFLYLQVRSSLLAQVDAALQLAATQVLLNVDEEDDPLDEQLDEQLDAQLVSEDVSPETLHNLADDFVIHLLTPSGTIMDTLSRDQELPIFPLQTEGFLTVLVDGEPWRVYSQAVVVEGQASQLQVGQELGVINLTLASLRAQLLLGLPLALLLAGLGGFFLASRALQPIDHITQTAQAISASDLDRRIHYEGPADEVGRLAQTFDTMLDRLQTAFVRERRFTGDAAHELRTPLAALKGRLGVTLSRPRQPATYRETLQEMEQQVDRLIRLSNDLLFMSLLEQAQFQLQQERIIMADLVSAVVEQVRPLAEVKSITLEESIYSGLTLQGDLDLLIRLHLNLLDNAIKYTSTGGRVFVQAEQYGSQALISIRDTGPGIAAEHLPHLFERFYRVESDRARWRRDNGHENGENGAGLGLAIAYEIARAHGGNLTVQSDVGKGTTFFVQLSAVS